MVNIDTVEVTPDQPVVGLVAVEVHDGQRKGPTQKVNSTTGETVLNATSLYSWNIELIIFTSAQLFFF